MGEELTALDATFLELEEADQSAHMHIGGVILIEPGPDGAPPPIEQIREDVLARLPDLPRYTQRLSATHDRRPALAELGGGHGLRRRPPRVRGRAACPGRPRPAHRLGRRVLLAAAGPHQAAAGRWQSSPRRRPLGHGHQDPPLHGRRGRLGRHGDDPARHAAGAAPPGRRRVERRRRTRLRKASRTGGPRPAARAAWPRPGAGGAPRRRVRRARRRGRGRLAAHPPRARDACTAPAPSRSCSSATS